MFKSYSERNKAKNSLVKVYGIAADQVENYLHKDAEVGKWGFFLVEDGEGVGHPVFAADFLQETPQDEIPLELIEAQAKAPQDAEPTIVPVKPEPAQDEILPETPQDEVAEVASPFGAFAFAQLTATHSLPVAPSEQKKKKVRESDAAESGGKIEKDRPEQNGIKRPSAGGKCREIWDSLDEMKAKNNRTPTSKEIKTVAQDKGWENVTTCIQYYQWRKFNGIKGRI